MIILIYQHISFLQGNFQGDLLVSLCYSPVSCKLAGIISKATGLRKDDMFGKAGTASLLNLCTGAITAVVAAK